MASLYRLCVLKTAWLLKNCFWCDVYEGNPFSHMPSHIVDDLLAAVLEITPSSGLQVPEVYHLLTSGQLRNIKIEDMYVKKDEFLSILMSITAACQNLRFLTLRNISFSDSFEGEARTLIREGLNCLLSISPQLEVVESCLEFDLKSLKNCQQLKVLKLNFKCGILHAFLDEVRDGWLNNEKLSVLEVYHDLKNYPTYLEIVPILQHCSALKEVNFDITGALEIMHTDALNSGSLNKQYKLKRAILGSAVYGCTNVLAVQIATYTCPQIEVLDVLVDQHDVVSALGDFQNLTSLLIQWDLPDGGDFQPAMKQLLKKIGPTLKSLFLMNFYDVDFAGIGETCPQLEELKVELRNETCHTPVPTECFKFLKLLHIEFTEEGFTCSENTFLMLLGNCSNLQKFYLNSAACLTDSVLLNVLRKNELLFVKDASILECSLTGPGLRHLIVSLSRLECIQFSSTQMEFEEASVIVHDINPRVLVEEVASDYFV